MLLSIGYSSCHWCHVMAHESFEDPDTAAVMNELFVNVKVDREERPDVDALYMQATLVAGRVGRLADDGVPDPRRAPVLRRHLLPARPPAAGCPASPTSAGRSRTPTATAATTSRARRPRSRGGSRPPAGAAGRRRSRSTARSWTTRSSASRALLRPRARAASAARPSSRPRWRWSSCCAGCARRPDDHHAREIVELTLGKMAAGGIYDQVGGGFHRYSVDGQLAGAPLREDALRQRAAGPRPTRSRAGVTGSPDARAASPQETLDYLLREMRLPGGGFAAAQDADSPGGEGAFFVWTPQELRDAAAAAAGPRRDPPLRGHRRGQLRGPHDPARVGPARRGLERARRGRRAAAGRRARATLYAARQQRPAPARDDKVIAAWNGLAIAALRGRRRDPRAAADYIDAAIATAAFAARRPGGRRPPAPRPHGGPRPAARPARRPRRPLPRPAAAVRRHLPPALAGGGARARGAGWSSCSPTLTASGFFYAGARRRAGWSRAPATSRTTRPPRATRRPPTCCCGWPG